MNASCHDRRQIMQRNRTYVASRVTVWQRLCWLVLIVAAWSDSACAQIASHSGSPDYRVAIRDDWAAQERRAGRQPGSDGAIQAALERTGSLLDNLADMQATASLQQERQTWKQLREAADHLHGMNEPARLELYHRVRWLTRRIALKNPLLADRPVAFLQRRRFICQMLHEYIGYYYNYADLAGGGVYVLEEPGHSFRTRDLIDGRLPRGAFATLAASTDQQRLYFAFAEVRDVQRNHQTGTDWTVLPDAAAVPDELNYYSPQRSAFHLFAVDRDGRDLRQLTFGCEDDFDPCPLPDGTLIFMSSRRGGFCRCDNPFEPIPTHTLHHLDPSTGNVKTLSWHETNEWHPSVLSDGRIVYCRWDYVDRSAAHYHGLWACNPDGTNPVSLFGNYTQHISACFQPRAIPGSQRIAFVAGAHHANVGGSLVILDPARVRLDPATGEDRFGSLERLTPEVCFPETAEGWPDSFFHSPYPLSEDHFLIAFSFDPLPGMSGRTRRDVETGIYYFDRFGNLELLYRRDGVCCVAPQLLGPRAVLPSIPSVLDPTLADQGEFVLADVNWSLLPLPAGRPVRQLRVFQILPKSRTHIANQPRIGYANAEAARGLLGTVPVEADGSAYFRAPAGKPLYFQAVDAQGRAVQTMRSVTYLQPGERRSCVGCHEPPGTAPPRRQLLATLRPPSTLTPGADGTRPLGYVRLVQPVLDANCVGCHGAAGTPGSAEPDLTGRVSGEFTRSYENLRPYVRWYEWGAATIAPTVTQPGLCGADASPLAAVLNDENHRNEVVLPPADLRRIYLWLDANAPFYGTYGEAERERQLSGQVVPVPDLQ
jgi:cytochrome c553